PRCGTPTPPRSSSSRPLSPAAPPPAWMRPTARSPSRSPTPPSSPCAPDGASHADRRSHRTPRPAHGRTDELRAHPRRLLRRLLEARPDVDLVVADPDGYGDVRGVR